MQNNMKWRFYFSVAGLLAILLIWTGVKLFTLTPGHFSTTLYVVVGLLILLGGFFLLAAIEVEYHWFMAGVLLLLGIYFLARASGTIQEPWLAKVFGVACGLAAAVLLYITWPPRHKHISGDY